MKKQLEDTEIDISGYKADISKLEDEKSILVKKLNKYKTHKD